METNAVELVIISFIVVRTLFENKLRTVLHILIFRDFIVFLSSLSWFCHRFLCFPYRIAFSRSDDFGSNFHEAFCEIPTYVIYIHYRFSWTNPWYPWSIFEISSHIRGLGVFFCYGNVLILNFLGNQMEGHFLTKTQEVEDDWIQFCLRKMGKGISLPLTLPSSNAFPSNNAFTRCGSF